MTTLPAKPQARELSAEEQQERVERCHELHTQIAASLRAGRAALWQLSKSLYEFKEEVGWSALRYESLNHYLADPEVRMKRSTFFTAVSRWEKVVVLRNVEEERLLGLDPSLVDIVLPKLEAGRVDLDEALDDVEALGARDLREKYRGKKELPSVDEDEDEDDGAPVQTSGPPDDDEGIEILGEDGEPIEIDEGDPTGRIEPLDEDEEEQAKPAQNSPHVDSGQVSSQAVHDTIVDAVVEIEAALEAPSDVVKNGHMRRAHDLLEPLVVKR